MLPSTPTHGVRHELLPTHGEIIAFEKLPGKLDRQQCRETSIAQTVEKWLLEKAKVPSDTM